MSRPVFSFRPNLKNPEHEKAWQILMEVPKERETLLKLIQETVREELKSGSMERLPVCEKEEIPDQMLDFLFQMEQE